MVCLHTMHYRSRGGWEGVVLFHRTKHYTNSHVYQFDVRGHFALFSPRRRRPNTHAHEESEPFSTFFVRVLSLSSPLFPSSKAFPVGYAKEPFAAVLMPGADGPDSKVSPEERARASKWVSHQAQSIVRKATLVLMVSGE